MGQKQKTIREKERQDQVEEQERRSFIEKWDQTDCSEIPGKGGHIRAVNYNEKGYEKFCHKKGNTKKGGKRNDVAKKEEEEEERKKSEKNVDGLNERGKAKITLQIRQSDHDFVQITRRKRLKLAIEIKQPLAMIV